MPALVGGHFIIYVVNLKKMRFEYLTRKGAYTRTVIFEVLGNWQTKEARAGIDKMYQVAGLKSPYKWNEWQWNNPKLPEQPDSTSCGVFVMKLLEQWEDDKEMVSFQTWKQDNKQKRIKLVRQMRMDLCVAILTSATNGLAQQMQEEADAYYRRKLIALMENAEFEKKKGKKANKKQATPKVKIQEAAKRGRNKQQQK